MRTDLPPLAEPVEKALEKAQSDVFCDCRATISREKAIAGSLAITITCQ